MFRQIITPETKEDLVIHLPSGFLGKRVEVEATEIKTNKQKLKGREKSLKEAFKFFDSISVDMSNFKFNREYANARQSFS